MNEATDMTRASLCFAAALVLLICSSGANAGIIQFTADLDPFQEVPPHNIPGFGFADVSLNTATGAVTISNGSYSGTGNLTAGQITDMMAGNTYINITDSVFPSGEIRGQILPSSVPEPSSVILFGLGAVALLPFARHRRKGCA
jgi:hypothetical protein